MNVIYLNRIAHPNHGIYMPEGAETELLAPMPAPPTRTSYRWVLWMMLWVTGVLFVMGSALVAMS